MPREHKILDAIVAGRLNKQISADLGLSVATVNLHRGRMMKKLGAKNTAEVVRLITEYQR